MEVPIPGRLKTVSVSTAPDSRHADFQADDGDDGDEGIAQGMFGDHHPLINPFGARRADIILAEHFEQAGAGHAGDDRERNGADRQGRQDQMPERILES